MAWVTVGVCVGIGCDYVFCLVRVGLLWICSGVSVWFVGFGVGMIAVWCLIWLLLVWVVFVSGLVGWQFYWWFIVCCVAVCFVGFVVG